MPDGPVNARRIGVVTVADHHSPRAGRPRLFLSYQLGVATARFGAMKDVVAEVAMTRADTQSNELIQGLQALDLRKVVSL
jgi:hypothetical protein